MSEYTRTRRWSEVIPPHTALSFAAIWDPDEGMVTFSGGQLLTSDLTPEARSEIPRDTDTYSQVLTLDGFSFPMTEGYPYGYGYGYNSGARSGRVPTVTFTLDALDEGQSVLDPFLRQNAQWRRAEGGGDARATHAHKRSGVIHLDFKAASAAVASFRHRLLHPFSPTAEAPDARDDGYDGFFEDVPVTAGTSTSGPVLVHLNLKSAFSMTDTSTAGYVDIDTPSVYSQQTSSYASVAPSLTSSLSEKWSTLRSIDVENIASCPNTRSGPRRLRKRRPADDTKPADPAEVLARAEFNHVRDSSASPSPSPSTSRSPSTRCKARLAKMMTDLPPLPCSLPTHSRSAPPTPQKERPQTGLHRFKSLPKLPKLSPPPSPVSTSMKGTTGCFTPTPTGTTSTPPTSFTQTWRGRRPARANTTAGHTPDRSGKTLRHEKSVTRLVKQSVEILTSRCRRPSTSGSGSTPCGPGSFARECCRETHNASP